MRKHIGYQPVEANVPPTAFSPTEDQLKLTEFFAISDHFQSIIADEKAKRGVGEKCGISLLHVIAIEAITLLSIAQENHPDIVNAFAEEVSTWPILFTADAKANRLMLKEMSQCKLGTRLPVPFSSAGITLKSGYFTAYLLYSLILPLTLNRDELLKMRPPQVDMKALRESFTDLKNDDSISDAERRAKLEEWITNNDQLAGDVHGGTIGACLDAAEKGIKTVFFLLTQELSVTDKSWEGICEEVRKDSESLPELSKDTWEQWFEVGWKIILYLTGDPDDPDAGPQTNPVLKPLGASALTKRGTPTGKPDRTVASDVRAEIKRRMKEAFKVCCGQKSAKDATASKKVGLIGRMLKRIAKVKKR